MLIMGWLSCDQSGGPIKQNRHPSHFVPGRQAKYTAVINITLILSDRALQRPVTSLAWVPRSTIGTLKGLSSSSLLIFCSVMRLSHQLQVWHQWHFFFCPPLHIKVGLLQHIKHGPTILGFSPLEWVWVKKVLWHWVTISYGCVHFNRCRANATELSYVHVDFSFFFLRTTLTNEHTTTKVWLLTTALGFYFTIEK